LGGGGNQNEALAAFGIDEPAPDSGEVDLFPENEAPLQVFLSMQTQWRIGMNGATGLDYAALPAVLALCGVKRKRRADVFSALRVMEAEALSIWAEQRK